MGSEGFLVIAIGLVIGFFLVFTFPKTKWGKKILEKRDHKSAVLNDPELLSEKLNEGVSGGKGCVDDGEKLKYSVGEEGGKKVVKLDKEKIKGDPIARSTPPKVKPKATKKKTSKKATK